MSDAEINTCKGRRAKSIAKFPSCQVDNVKISSPFIDRAEIGGTSGEVADFPEIALRKFASVALG